MKSVSCRHVKPTSLPKFTPVFGSAALVASAGNPAPNVEYWRLFLEAGPHAVASNLRARPGVLAGGGGWFPLVLNCGEAGNSYPCSLLTQYVHYPLGEMRLLKGALFRAAVRAGLHGLGAVLAAGGVDRVVQWNSWLLSTNLLPSVSSPDVQAATASLVAHHPEHAVLVKNVHGREDPDLPRVFEENGYQLMPSRKVYFFDGKPAAFLSRNNVKQDLGALRKLKEYTPVEHHEIGLEEAPRILRLYEMLYLEKHSRWNPQYTAFFVRKALEKRLLEFRALRHASGRIDAVFGCFRSGNVVTTPFVGYDTGLQTDPGLYRLIVAMLLKRVAEEGVLLNYSSGAGDFKRRRGGEGCLEYNALYTRHLPLRRRLPFFVLEQSSRHFGRRFLSGNLV